MSNLLKAIAVHTIVGNGPHIDSLTATAAPSVPRTFVGTGAPGSSTLNSGNGKFNGIASGYVINATLYAAGSGYAVADVLTISSGTGTALQITVDMVNASGAIVDFHISRVGSYSVYPGAVTSVTGGTGTSAQFLINVPSPDYYLDDTTLTAPVLYVCTTAGNKSTSVWAKVSGGGGTNPQQFKVQGDAGDYWDCYTWDGTTLGSTQIQVAKPVRLRCLNGIASETLRGITYTYTFTGTGSGNSPFGSDKAEYSRGVSGSDGSSATELLVPSVLPNEIIEAIPYATTAPSTLASVIWLYVGPAYWAA